MRNGQSSQYLQLDELASSAKTRDELAEKMRLIQCLAQKARLQSDDLFDFKEQDFPENGAIRGSAR